MAALLTARIEVIEPTMVRVPGGWFWMGCEIGRDDEKPRHRVWLDAFELSAYQVTNEEYACFLTAMRYPEPMCWKDPNFNHPKMPVVAISWHEAVGYCAWLNRETSMPYRLPSEAEWERAARGGVEHSLYSWGDTPPELLPNYARRWKTGPEPVGLYPPNAYGLYNLGDNVHEWCVSTGTTPATTSTLPNEIRQGQRTATVELREVAPGGTTSRSPALRRDRVFRLSSNTPTTVSESRDPPSPETVFSHLASKASL